MLSVSACARTTVNSDFTMRPPNGWIQFCQRQVIECIPDPRLEPIHLNRKTLKDITDTNSRINQANAWRDDEFNYDVPEYWTFLIGGFGDCEDYALTKRHELMLKGYPLSDLLLIWVSVADKRSKTDFGHIVLRVVTDKHDLILDYPRNNRIFTENDYPSNWILVYQQSRFDPNVWVKVKSYE